MENGNENKYENDDVRELSPLLQVSTIDDAKTAQNSRGSKRFVALLLLVVATTVAAAAAAAMMVLLNSSSSTGVVNPLASAVSSLLGTGRKIGESCEYAGWWWNACDENLSCYDPGVHEHDYCVPKGKENACCGSYAARAEASGIFCREGLSCLFIYQTAEGTVSTCHPKEDRDVFWPNPGTLSTAISIQTGPNLRAPIRPIPSHRSAPYTLKQAKKGSCNINTGKPANSFIEVDCGYDGFCRPSPGICTKKGTHNNVVDNYHCAKCADGYDRWPCNMNPPGCMGAACANSPTWASF